MDENYFVEKIKGLIPNNNRIIRGIGDDCAVIKTENPDKYMLFAVDQLISDVHYDIENTSSFFAGAKLLKRNISDIAAMGGYPAEVVVTVASSGIDMDYLMGFYDGLISEANKWNINICGGDTASIKMIKGNLLVTTLSITGYVNKNNLCLRSNAKPKQLLYATGSFGNSYLTGHHLSFAPRLTEGIHLASRYTNAMMDVSDGLLMDLTRFAKESNLSFFIDTDKILPRANNISIKNILTDGEDYELIFTVDESIEKSLIENWIFSDVPITRIGYTKNFDGESVYDIYGKVLSKNYTGYEHKI